MTRVAKIVAVSVFLALGAGVAGYSLNESKPRKGAALSTAAVEGGDAAAASVVGQGAATQKAPLVQDAEQPTASVPAIYALQPNMVVPVGSTWDALVAGMSDDERALAETLRSSYPEAYDFSSEQQMRWMLENGFPMPSEYVLAQRLGREQLLRLANAGNRKASMLAYDMILNELQDETDEAARFDADVQLITIENAASANNCSPFMQHEKARRLAMASEHALPELRLDLLQHMAAAYGVAANLGDWRTTATTREVARSLDWDDKTSLAYAERVQLLQNATPRDCKPTRLPEP